MAHCPRLFGNLSPRNGLNVMVTRVWLLIRYFSNGDRRRGVLSISVVCATILLLALPAHGEDRAGPNVPKAKPKLARTSGVAATLSLDCPTLPACPGGLSFPLPPSLDGPMEIKTPSRPRATGKVIQGTGKYAEMILVPAGPFDEGSPDNQGRVDERPVQRVHLKSFYLAKHEVTVQDYCDFLNAQGEKSRDNMPRVKLDSPNCPLVKDRNYFQPKPGMADKPMVCVSWYGAADYAEWAGGRLPTSAEWEKAALLTSPYQPGDYLSLLSRADSVPVAIATPGIMGVTGMIGNVWEWCSDWYAREPSPEPSAVNPTGPALGKEKVIRGGSWASPEASKRIHNRHKASPRGYFRTVGFRIVKD
jgi:formylglycine-generating enzyme required for sulfatase activity